MGWVYGMVSGFKIARRIVYEEEGKGNKGMVVGEEKLRLLYSI